MYQLTEKEKINLDDIESKYYMFPPLDVINKEVSKVDDKKVAWKNAFDNLHDFMRSSQNKVNKLLEKRLEKGEIRDLRQTRVSIVGNMFSNLIIYIFIKNKIYESIRSDIYITSKPSAVKNFKKITAIKIGKEIQKPDVDLIIYTEKESRDVNKCIILSLKTSLRERAGQTYKWKLLMEIAATENPVKEKYDIEYNPENMPLVCFATVNFYNEINNPQHRGMFKFFDGSFIGKKIDSKFIKPLSYLVEYVNEKL